MSKSLTQRGLFKKYKWQYFKESEKCIVNELKFLLNLTAKLPTKMEFLFTDRIKQYTCTHFFKLIFPPDRFYHNNFVIVK